MKNNQLAIKVYDIDYTFIIKNYLDRELWKKEWTLFVYKDFVVKLRLANIKTISNTIEFEIKSNKESVWDSYDWTTYKNYTSVSHNLENSNIEILKKQINTAIRILIDNYEMGLITKEDGYEEIYDFIYNKKQKLREIAEEFLDDNDVSNNDIREAYIDRYVSDNIRNEENNLYCSYRNSRQYNVATDLQLIYCEITKNEERKREILNNIDGNIDEIMEKIKEELKLINDNDEDYIDTLKDNLESI